MAIPLHDFPLHQALPGAISYCFIGGQGRNRTTDTRIFSILADRSLWLPILPKSSVFKLLPVAGTVGSSSKFQRTPRESLHNYTGTTRGALRQRTSTARAPPQSPGAYLEVANRAMIQKRVGYCRHHYDLWSPAMRLHAQRKGCRESCCEPLSSASSRTLDARVTRDLPCQLRGPKWRREKEPALAIALLPTGHATRTPCIRTTRTAYQDSRDPGLESPSRPSSATHPAIPR